VRKPITPPKPGTIPAPILLLIRLRPLIIRLRHRPNDGPLINPMIHIVPAHPTGVPIHPAIDRNLTRPHPTVVPLLIPPADLLLILPVVLPPAPPAALLLIPPAALLLIPPAAAPGSKVLPAALRSHPVGAPAPAHPPHLPGLLSARKKIKNFLYIK